jgi:hypothetical protein
MLARSTKINHPLGVFLETPLMIPSFSSKGFTFIQENVSEATELLRISKEFLTESLLISAYDLYHHHIPFTDEFFPTELTILDSGGYETSDVYDFSTTSKYSYPIKDWNINNYEEIIVKWPEYKAAIIVSYDHGKERFPLDRQIFQAESLFQKYPLFLSSFLIKPETDKQRYVQMDNILESIEKMKKFSVIGITEKELGNSVLARMLHIAQLRSSMDAKGMAAPIHVFGSLDPVSSILYFLAGAEIFDGLTWLKYSYHQGAAIYQSNYGVLKDDLGINVKDFQVRAMSIVNNIYCLEQMKYLMKDFAASDNKFNIFDQLSGGLGSLLEKMYNRFQSNLK